MLVSTQLTLTADSPVGRVHQLGTSLQSLLMTHAADDFATELHQTAHNPYSQNVRPVIPLPGQVAETAPGLGRPVQTLTWVINAFDEGTAEKLIQPFTNTHPVAATFQITNPQPCTLTIASIEESRIDPKAWTKAFYTATPPRLLRLHFITPTSFKQSGSYSFFPDMRLVFQNLQIRYAAFLGEDAQPDDDLLGELVGRTRLVGYNLRSQTFFVHGSRIPAFVGNLTLAVGGAQTLAAFANLLFTFGSYAGVGAKTSMGMGAFRFEALEDRRTQPGTSSPPSTSQGHQEETHDLAN